MDQAIDARELLLDEQEPAYELLTRHIPQEKADRMSMHELEALVANPIRGAVVENSSVSRKTSFIDITSQKHDLIVSLSSRMEQPDKREQATSALWRIAISEEPGVDVNWDALSMLVGLTREKDDQVLRRLETIASSDEGRKGDFAAFVLCINHLSDSGDTYERSLRATQYQPMNIAFDSRVAGSAFGDSSDVVAVSIFQEVVRMSQANRSADDINTRQVEILKEFSRKKEIIDRDIEEHSLPPLGPEIQGLNTTSLPVLGGHNHMVFISASPKDYEQYRAVGSFIPSPDKPYEFAMLPKQSAYEIALMIQQLFKSGLITSKDGSTGLDVTIAGLKSSPEAHREPMALQLMVLAANYGRFSSVMDYTTFSLSWDVDTLSSGVNSKAATNIRKKGEMTPVGGEQPEVGTELRIFALDEPEKTYKMLHLLQEIGSLAIEHQKEKANEKHNIARSNAWKYLTQQANELFRTHNLPDVEAHWRFKDLKALNDLLESSDGVQFQNDMRHLLTTSRLSIHGHNWRLIRESVEQNEQSQDRVTCVHTALDRYDSTIKKTHAAFLRTHPELRVSLLQLDVAKKMIPAFWAMALSPIAVNALSGGNTNELAQFAANIVSYEIFSNPGIYLTAIRSFVESIQQRRIIIPKDIINRIPTYEIGLTAGAIMGVLAAITDKNPLGLAWATSALVALRLGKKALKPYTRIESHWQEGHE